ncbi:unnamed protein product [Symbiodinium sp. CCMP2456]|nr:unnamed protein product [Symbiodinium sp. CCMP2456]
MPQQSEAKHLVHLTAVPAGWPLATVIDAFLQLAAYHPSRAHASYAASRAPEVVSARLVELWTSQPAEAEAWLQRCREHFAKELAGKETRPELLSEALLRHGAAEYGKYGWCWSFSEAGLLRGEPLGSAAERESWAAGYLQQPPIPARCRELAERLAEAESLETARKRQKLEEETAERRRLEAELQKSQEEGRELRNRLAAAEAQVSSKDAELQTAQSESAKCTETCNEFVARAAAAESAAAEFQERCEEFATRMQASEAEASEHAKTKERLAQAEADENLSLKDGSQRSETGQSTELQVEKAVLQDRCEQLQQQLAEARGQLEVLWEERGRYQERLRQLAEMNRKQESHHHRHPTFNPPGAAPSKAAFGEEESDLAEQLGYSLVDEDLASVLSGSSGCSVQQNCFMLDAIFNCRMDVLREGRDLQIGSQVLAGDGKTVVEVVEIKEARATEVVDLKAAGATLRVTPDHPVQIPDAGAKAGRHLYLPAGKLKVGDFVMNNSGEPVALTTAQTLPTECNVLKIVFKPDLPVAVFPNPSSCILSKGHKKSQNRRSVRGRGQEAADPMDEGASIPDTAAGEYTD